LATELICRLSLADALALCELLAATDPQCYERAALRCLQRIIDDTSPANATTPYIPSPRIDHVSH
jgi:hypothetical protein